MFYLFLLILLFPIFQMKWNIVNPQKLNGSFVPAENGSFTFNSWVSTQYQSSKEKYIKENIGFRSYFILNYNQMMYSLYNMAVNPGGVVGKDNYLYLESYIYNETGENYLGDDQINLVTKRLLFLQEYFAKQGIDLLTVFVPSKASYFPEYIPDRYKQYPKSNYKAYCQSFDSLSINYIDLNKYFLEIKKEAKYPVFPKNGIHWTDYGMAVAMDSVIHKIEELQGVELLDFSWEEPIELEIPYDVTDFDAENLMNLIFEMPRDKMPYPKFVFEENSLKKKPKTIVICDSYYWKSYSKKIPHHIFDWGGFWYYFNTARYNDGKNEVKTPVDEFDLVEKFSEQDVVVLFASQATLHLFPYRFDETMFNLLLPYDSIAFEQHLKEQILTDSIKYNMVIQTARDNKVSFEVELKKQMDIDAIAFTGLNDPKQQEINKIKATIRSDKKWYQIIVQKAEKRNVSTEEMLLLDATWMYNQKKKKEEAENN